jgi:hypothetical protein
MGDRLLGGDKPPEPRAPPEAEQKRHGRNGAGNGARISERIKALKVKAQECYRGETNPAGGRDGLRTGSLKAWKRYERALVGRSNPRREVGSRSDAGGRVAAGRVRFMR